MPALANVKHEIFAQGLAEGKSANAAYADAGYAPNDGNCIRLKGNERITARVVELQAITETKAEITRDTIVSFLAEDRSLAYEVKSPSAAVSASMGLAKVLGMITEKTEGTLNLNVCRSLLELAGD